ncbi:MAG: phosphatidate cytidylyltransferase [Pedobacter sp.]|nr:phosphatidate cytidylyltransferase [Pedobacter sp.]MDQ8052541.1 phosphatidate cytidylyltransferase [Pedobacter sp.]
MKTRAITAFFFTIVMLASLWNAYTFTAFYLLLSVAALFEFYKLIKIGGIRPHRNMAMIVATIAFLIMAAYHFFQFGPKYLLLIIPLIFAIFIFELYKKEKIPFANIAYTFVGFVYVTIPFCFFYSLGFLSDFNQYSFHLPLSFLMLLWANDTGAYLFGMNFGKHRLFERHSPKKSWEGFFGGMLTSVLVSYLVSFQFTELSPAVWGGMAILIACFGTLGDLVESMLKRSLNAKDSGSILPGHGGLLDRFDGLLISAPIVFVYLYLILN